METTARGNGWSFIGGLFGGIGIGILSAIMGGIVILFANYGARVYTIIEYASWFAPAIIAIVGGILGVRKATTRLGKWGVILGIIIPVLFLGWFYGREALG
jgi:hypothetical protein